MQAYSIDTKDKKMEANLNVTFDLSLTSRSKFSKLDFILHTRLVYNFSGFNESEFTLTWSKDHKKKTLKYFKFKIISKHEFNFH